MRLWLLPVLAILSAVVVRVTVRAGVVDRPGPRSSHDRPTPKGGGTGPVAAVVAGAAVTLVAGAPLFHPFVLCAAAALAILALLDDAYDFPFAVKLLAQFLAAAAAVGSGVVLRQLDLPGLPTLTLGAAAVPLTLAWILFTTNAVNFIDGLNGLASGSSLLAALLLAVLAPPTPATPVCLWLAAGLAGFLPFNYPRARIFMGDVGSQFCGYLLAVLSVAAAQPGALTPTDSLIGPLLLLGILFDVAFTLCRRALAGQRIWQAHRSHLYQVAQRAFLPAPLVAALHWAFVLWGGLCAAMLLRGSAWALPLALAPQLAWAVVVVALARRAPIGRW